MVQFISAIIEIPFYCEQNGIAQFIQARMKWASHFGFIYFYTQADIKVVLRKFTVNVNLPKTLASGANPTPSLNLGKNII